LSLHTRGEYATSDAPGAFLGGNTGKVFALTETVQYDLWKNVLSRLELRWDHSASGAKAYGGTFGPGGVAGPATKKNAFLVAANVIYKF
jgi:hypothetical protein